MNKLELSKNIKAITQNYYKSITGKLEDIYVNIYKDFKNDIIVNVWDDNDWDERFSMTYNIDSVAKFSFELSTIVENILYNRYLKDLKDLSFVKFK